MSYGFLRIFGGLAVALCLAAPVRAAIIVDPAGFTTYTGSNKADFLIAAPGLTLEDFNSTAATSFFATCPGSFNASTNNACFGSGDIVAGISVSATDLGGLGNMLNAPAGSQLGNTVDLVGPNSGADDLVIAFSGNPTAIGIDLTSFNTSSGILTVTIADLTPTIPITVSVGPANSSSFFGIIANTAITSISFAGNGIAEAVSSVQFGVPQTGSSSSGGTPIPEPGTLLLSGIGFAAAFRLRRRTAR